MNKEKKSKKKFEINFKNIVKNTLLGVTFVGFVYSIFLSFENITRPDLINIYLIAPFILFLTPYLFYGLYGIRKVQSKMKIIPRFLRDIVDNFESGMDLVSSIVHTKHNEYTILNDDVIKLINQLSWGINFDIALNNFAKSVGSKDLSRDFRLVIEARKVGGHVEKMLRELSEKISLDNLRKHERKSNLSSNTFTGYISFFIFLFIIILTYNNLFLELSSSISGGQENVSEIANQKVSIYLSLLIFLSYEISILSGFLFGLMQENDIISGAPHVVALTVCTFIGFFFFV